MRLVAIRLFQAGLLAVVAALLSLVMFQSRPAAAQSAGGQCIAGFYQYNDGLLRRFEPEGGTSLTIGTYVAEQLQAGLPADNRDLIINAGGFNTLDGLIYSLVTDPIDTDDAEHNGLNGGLANTQRPNYVHLVSTDPATGVVTDLGEPTQAGVAGYNLTQVLTNVQTWNGSEWSHTSFSMGDMFGGHLYAAVGGANDSDNKIYKIDVTTNTYEVIDIAYTAGVPGTVELSGDLVYLDGFLYSIEGAHTRDWPFPSRLVRIEVANGTGEVSVVDSLPIQDRVFGSLWLAQDGSEHRLFTYDNSTGQVYEVFNFVSGTPSTTAMTTLPTATNSDGISCVDAEVTGFEVNADDEAVDVETDTGAVVDWRDGDTGTTAYSLTNFDATTVEGGEVVNNGDGTFTYTPPAGFTGSDSFTYQICLDGVVPDVCDTATIALTVADPPADTSDDGGAVLGATTDGASSDDGGSVLGEGDVLAETGAEAFIPIIGGLFFLGSTMIVMTISRPIYSAK